MYARSRNIDDSHGNIATDRKTATAYGLPVLYTVSPLDCFSYSEQK